MQSYLRLVGLPGLDNAGMVEGGIYRSQRPEDPLGYHCAVSRLGIRSVIDLEDLPDPAEVITELGLTVIHRPMSTLSRPSAEDIRQFLAAVKSAPRPALIHCAHGRERTGWACAVLRIVAGWALADAEEEMLHYGFREALAFELKASLEDWVHVLRGPVV